MIKKLRDTAGDFSINGVFILLLVFMLLVLSITTIGVANQAVRVHSMAAELTRYIEVRGQVDSAAYAELARLESLTGIDTDCTIQATYLGGSTKLQYGAPFTVRLDHTARFGIGGVLSVPVELHSTVSGRGEFYWK